MGFSSRGTAAMATGMNARDPETEDVDLRSGIEKAVLLAAMTRLAATRDGAAMFTSETADMSSEQSDGRSSRRRMRCSKCGWRATISANPIGAADILPSSNVPFLGHTPTDTMHAATARIFGPVASASRTRRVSARRLSRASNRRIRGVAPLKAKEAEPGDAVEEISTAMADARVCEESGLSPGAGLADADAQADAAFADMINTTIDVTGEALDSEELSRLSRAGRMDEESKSKKSGGILGDVKDLFGALSKGAHIVKQKGGRV